MLLAFALLCLTLWGLQPVLSNQYGLVISVLPWHAHTATLLAGLAGLALLLGAIPSYLTYRQSLAQGLTVRL